MTKVFLTTGSDLPSEWTKLRSAYESNDTRAHGLRVFELALDPCLKIPLAQWPEYKELVGRFPVPGDQEYLSDTAFRAYIQAYIMIMRKEGIISFSEAQEEYDFDQDIDVLGTFLGGGQ